MSGSMRFDDVQGALCRSHGVWTALARNFIKDQLEQKMIVGMNFNYKKFLRVKADLTSNEHYVWKKPAAAVGLESFLNRWVVLRLGVKRDFFTENNYFGTGLGFVGPKFSIHYAYLSGQETEKSTRHTLDLNVPIW